MEYTGLSSAEARQRLEQFGTNEFERRSQVTWWGVLFSQFKSPLVYILVLATLATIWLGEYTDAAVIAVAVLVNTAFGFFQEYRAGKALEALARMLNPKARVKRDGEWQEIELSQVVPGDIARLELGQSVPADGILIESEVLFVNEAVLTGESLPVEKKVAELKQELSKTQLSSESWWEEVDAETKMFQGTTVASGLGQMLVVRTGGKTSFGQIAQKVATGEEQSTPLQLKLQQLGRNLTIMLGIISGVVFALGLATGKSLGEIFPTAIALAVAAIPEGLLVGLTLILSVGMNRILKQKGLVRRLLAAETLGSVDVVCLDKTGTLTEGKMSVTGVVISTTLDPKKQLNNLQSQDKKQKDRLLLGMALCNDQLDPLEIAMDEWVRQELSEKEIASYKRLDRLPFDPKHRYTTVRVKSDKGEVIDFFSGAPEVVLEHCKLSPKEKKLWLKRIEELGILGYRIIALADSKPAKSSKGLVRKQLKNFNWLGLVAFGDPVRAGVGKALKQAQLAGIKLKIITGDYQETAWSVLTKLGIVEGELDPEIVVTGDELEALTRKDNHKEISEHIEKAILFARVTPDQKLSIVKVLQDFGHIVAMTGDGVNDAPALRKADIGLVVSEASDVSKETADMVLLDNNFATILSAVEEGRAIFTNLRRLILYLMADAFAAIILVMVALVVGWPLPLLAVQILWINLISDGLPHLALAIEPKDKDLLKRPPTPSDAPLIDRHIMILIAVISITAGVLSLGLFYRYYFILGLDLEYARSVVFAGLGAMTLVYVYSVRALTAGIWQVNIFRNPWLILATVMGLFIQLSAIYWPPLMAIFSTQAVKLEDWLVIGVLLLVLMFVIELVKWILRHLDIVKLHSSS
jgi:Ca2+-transporting ATPase